MKTACVAGMGLACVGAVACAGTISLNPSRDNTLYEVASRGDTSNALGAYVFSGLTAAPSKRRALLQFDLSSIPPGSVINSVMLTMSMDRGSGGGAPVTLHRVTTGWGQGTSNAGEPGGVGTAASADDPTWFFSHFSTINWTIPGGDFAATVSGSTPITDPGVYVWGSTTGMVADVQSWVDAAAGNFGWILIGGESTAGSAIRFSSKEGLVPPVLAVTFTPPSACGTSDFDGDGDFGTDADIEAFFACLGGNCCATCSAGGADFNGDGDTGTDADIEAFFRVLGGGGC